MTVDLSGRVALVTGGARGIGRAYALRLAARGAKVGVLDRDLASFKLDPAEERSLTAPSVVEEITRAGGVAMGLQADVTDAAAMSSAADELADAFGVISIAVANAGGGGFGAPGELEQPASDVQLAGAQSRFAGNVFGTMNTVRAVAGGMKSQRYGKIVTIGSVSGLIARPDGSHADYGAAKAAIAFYTSSLANELGPFGITVNCLAPGLILTPRIEAKYTDSAALAELTQNVALNRLGTTDDCADALEFLVSHLSDYVTGTVIPVTGGTRIPRWGPPPTPWWN